MKIGTHSGTFHADEALAVYMLKLLPKWKDAQVIRTRNLELLDTCDIVVDVGAKYEPPKYFDHHQREFGTNFDDKHKITKLSSAGLVYKHFGREILAHMLKVEQNSTILDVVFPKIYNTFIEAVDAYDNGVNPHEDQPKFSTYGNTLRAVVSNLNPLWTEPETDEYYDECFVKASDFMGYAFEAEVRNVCKGWYPARDAVVEAFKKSKEYDPEGRILVFDRYVPWKGHLYDLEPDFQEILFAVYPSPDSWRVQAVSVTPSSFENRKSLPEAWRGLRDAELSEKSGIPDSVFVHAAGFIGGNKTKEGALRMAREAL